MTTTQSLGFDGASNEYRLQRKGLLKGDADKIAARELQYLWARSHHLCRNNAAAITAKNRLQAHWIGAGIKVNWSSNALQKLWDSFASDPSIDSWGDLYNLQNLWAGGYFESGEIFTRMIVQRTPGQSVPLKLQTLEAEYLDPLFYAPENTNYGIKFDQFGRPLEYNFWKRNPYNLSILGTGTIERVAVPASDVLHIFQRDRPGQWRGIPKLTSVMLPLYEMDELTDATLVRQKAAQAIGWIIKKREQGALPLIGALQTEPVQSTDPETGKSKKLQKILPGGIHYLQNDEDFVFASTDDIGPNLVVLLEHQWHLIASALDVTYEQLTGDLSNVNFSSIRAGLIEFRRRVAVIQQLIFINLAIKPLTARFKELASIYTNLDVKTATCKFILPKTEWVDPLKDIQADVLEIQAGLATLHEKLGQRGIEDFEDHIKTLTEEQELSVVLTTNPSKNAKPDAKAGNNTSGRSMTIDRSNQNEGNNGNQ